MKARSSKEGVFSLNSGEMSTKKKEFVFLLAVIFELYTKFAITKKNFHYRNTNKEE